MPVRNLIPYSMNAHKIAYVDLMNDPYVKQCIQDLQDTLLHLQTEYDKQYPGCGYGVGLAAHDIELPYQPISATDPEPAPGFYPQDFVPPNLYILNVRPERAAREGCGEMPFTVFINAEVIPLEGNGRVLSTEASFTLSGFVGINVPRYQDIKLLAQDEHENWNAHLASGFLARIHQHQTDSALGMEYLSRLEFTPIEMKQLQTWLKQPAISKADIVSGKLRCDSNTPHLNALKAWAKEHENMFQLHRTIHETQQSGRKIIVVGASCGLGLAFARYYLRYGYTVVAIYHQHSDSTALQVYKEKYTDKLVLYGMDVTREPEVKRFSESVSIHCGDVIIYNVGIKGYQGVDKQLEESSPTRVKSEYDFNFRGQFLLAKYLYHQLTQSNVLWVHISTLTNTNKIDHKYSSEPNFVEKAESSVYNLYVGLCETWCKLENIPDPKAAPLAFTVCPGWNETKTGDYQYHAASDQIVGNIVHNCIRPLSVSKKPGIYAYTGECKKELSIAPCLQEKSSSRSRFSIGSAHFIWKSHSKENGSDHHNQRNRKNSF